MRADIGAIVKKLRLNKFTDQIRQVDQRLLLLRVAGRRVVAQRQHIAFNQGRFAQVQDQIEMRSAQA